MDVVLAPTRFVQSACAAAIPPDRVLHYPQAVFLPDGDPTRSRGVGAHGEGRDRFVVSFDIGSDIERKNPWAALEAFRQAFPDEPDVRLVIKTKPWPGVESTLPRPMSSATGWRSDRRIRVVDRSLTYAEVLGLYASGDVMLSLHRSEGLGLHLMEAMSLGKVVVATDWSGNMDFMTSQDSVPVGYRLVPVVTRHSHYLPRWVAGAVLGRGGCGEAAGHARSPRGSRRDCKWVCSAAEWSMRKAVAHLRGDPFAALEERLREGAQARSRPGPAQ